MVEDQRVQRTVSAHLDLYLYGPADLIFSIAVADGYNTSESLDVLSDRSPVQVRELSGRHGARLHRVAAPAGPMTITYQAVVAGHVAPTPVDELDLIEYLRPSRYCESDTLFATARSEFNGTSGLELLRQVAEWVTTRLRYVPGASQPIDGAVATLLARAGVCRDYAHLVVALLRAKDVPARVVSVYAPGLAPMDFHAVAEAFVDGAWHIVDATGLAPRDSMVRIATGLDASGTAFLSQYGSAVNLRTLQVQASVDELVDDDHHAPAQLR